MFLIFPIENNSQEILTALLVTSSLTKHGPLLSSSLSQANPIYSIKESWERVLGCWLYALAGILLGIRNAMLMILQW